MKLDAFLLERATRLSHWLQRTTGLTCYFIAKLGVFVAGSSLLVDIVNHFLKFLQTHTPLWVVVLNMFLFLVMVLNSLDLTKADETIGDGVLPRHLQPYVTQGPTWRLVVMSVTLVSAGLFAWDYFFGRYRFFMLEFMHAVWFPAGMTVFYYFVAVLPLPPGKSKVRRWLENLRRTRVPVSVGS
jgi:hypothetical protein